MRRHSSFLRRLFFNNASSSRFHTAVDFFNALSPQYPTAVVFTNVPFHPVPRRLAFTATHRHPTSWRLFFNNASSSQFPHGGCLLQQRAVIPQFPRRLSFMATRRHPSIPPGCLVSRYTSSGPLVSLVKNHHSYGG